MHNNRDERDKKIKIFKGWLNNEKSARFMSITLLVELEKIFK